MRSHALEQLLPPFQLAVTRILDLDAAARWFLRHLVWRILPLANNALQIHRDDLLKQQASVTFDVIEVENP